MRSKAVRRVLASVMGLGLTASALAACEPPDPGPPVDVYAFAGGCYVLRDDTGGGFAARDATGWRANAGRAQATPLRLQATALGSYLLYGTSGNMPAAAPVGDSVVNTTAPGPSADWKMTSYAGKLRLRNVQTNKGLTVAGGRLAQTGSSVPNRWSLVSSSSACATFPDIAVNATGTPLRGASATAPVRGFLDAHTHVSAFRFLGGKFHCGRPWSPYGPAVALQDCPDHSGNGVGAVAENFFTTGTPFGSHSNGGWPTFDGWPRPESLTHEGTYWRWIERAWRGGLRIMVNDLVENRALCEIYPLTPETHDCNEMNSVRTQARDMYGLQDYIDAQFKGPGKGFFRIVRTPQEARAVINQGKLAVVLGVEVSEVLDCGRGTTNGPTCNEPSIEAQLDELHGLGVRSLFPVHKFDNGLGGTHFDSGGTGLLVNTGNKYATGEWWDTEDCAVGAETDNTPTNLTTGAPEVIQQIAEVPETYFDDYPAYGSGPVCNPKGLTDLGRFLINELADRGMIIETDHFSVKARDEALAILEGRGYGGLITSHSWGDDSSQRRLQALGGVVSPYAEMSTDYVETWETARALAPGGALPGIGYGTDTNGLGAQASARPGAATDNPVVYPYRTFDGGTVMQQQVSGSRTYDVNRDGAAHYGLFPDWVEDLRLIAGPEIVDDMANGAEAYLQMWAAAQP